METISSAAPITLNGDWVESVKESIPDHSKDIRLNVDSVIKRSPLDEVDTHAIAYVAAIAAGNGGLAFEIEMNSPLFKFEQEREAAKTAASLMGMNNMYYPFVEMCNDPDLKGLPPGLRMNAYANHAGVSKKKFEMYALAASIIGKCHFCVKNHYDTLKKEGMTVQELQHVGKIASVINAIGKIAI
jgi:alkyl hydroperoxide reductase subunit D